ncbi:hypothetical protein SAMN05216452_1186 [Nitratireductor aquibiodomus]|uniref:Uncharacterized protein n=2 Tax=Nitratireductor aquibiodomus TaxID=204799 RepID=A0A1H4JCQ4_9HYPH|nr:hypothetical protein SAMN05216452_1186 [Nitratireductor aquibiodomus]
MAFLSFIYSNLSRFKRFKGLGFEAELWEDKQKEAADLIERLKNVVSIYTHETVMNDVLRGRFSDGVRWNNTWTLFNNLVSQHDVLGQKIDFSSLKRDVDSYFLFDMCMPAASAVQIAIENAKREARQKIDTEFGTPIRDAAGYGARIAKLNEITSRIEEPFTLSKSRNLARVAIDMAAVAREKLKSHFEIDLPLDQEMLDRLHAIESLYENRPVQVTDELILWADRWHH